MTTNAFLLQQTWLIITATAAARWQQRGGCGGGISVIGRCWRQLGDGAAAAARWQQGGGWGGGGSTKRGGGVQRDDGSAVAAARMLRRWRQHDSATSQST